MADTIDLDEMEIADEDEESADTAYGDWLWRGEGDPEDEPEPRWQRADAGSNDADAPAEANANTTEDETSDAGDGAAGGQPVPKVPGGPSGPVGVPESKGGSGGGTPSSATRESSGPEQTSAGSERTTDHGDDGDPDDMTLAFTYEAINRLADPQYAVADARSWSDWIGIVGTVSTPAIRKFQRDAGIDIDFFGGSESGPAQRLADVTDDSMFYAERMVLVGVNDDEEIADAADWEFIPLETAAENAEWEIEFES